MNKETKVWQFFEREALGGRAVLNGTRKDPDVWIVRVMGLFAFCFAGHDEVLWVPANSKLKAALGVALRFDRLHRKEYEHKPGTQRGRPRRVDSAPPPGV